MKILLINKFLYRRAGAETSFLDTARLLSSKGHEVILWGMDDKKNPENKYKNFLLKGIDYNKPLGLFQSFKAGLDLLYNFKAKNQIKKLISRIKPDIAHIHNIAHQISPSILDSLYEFKIPTAMTLHDYKLFCPNYRMFTQERYCDECKNSRFHRCFLNKCVKDSYPKSLLTSLEMFLHHNILKIYDKVNTFTSPSLFLIQKARDFGLKKEIIHHKYFMDAKNCRPSYDCKEKALLYFGRLSSEKGIMPLIETVKSLKVNLRIAGGGPLKEEIEKKIKNEKINNVFFLGYKEKKDLDQEIGSILFTVVPSLWHENSPFAVLESFVKGKPVIASNTGGIPELVKDMKTGLIFNPQNTKELGNKISFLYNNPGLVKEMGQRAREFIEEEFDPDQHYLDLMHIYKQTIAAEK
ncbi:MAG: glycosyltransferase family 4 protein [Candidatus Omnitrophica bacterium]|nr:glycosyltransferase family 4 protein [Candidatus Omnitrophota bacterium]